MKHILTIISLLVLCSCNSWLDVSPKSEMRGDEHYNTVDGFKQTLVGCYISMSQADLYGKNLSWYMTEILANQYEKDYRDETGQSLYDHEYQNPSVALMSQTIWDRMYNVIVNVNDALRHLEGAEDRMTPVEYHQIRGELYALRAYLHFDLMRLYGAYAPQKDFVLWSTLKSIPYQTTVSKDFPPQKTNGETVAMLMGDIEQALKSLKISDPLVSDLSASSYRDVNLDGFFDFRNLRLNYVAVLALKARLLQWQGTPALMSECRGVADDILALVPQASAKGASFNTKMEMVAAKKVNASNLNLFDEAIFGIEVPKISDLIGAYLRLDFENKVYAMWISEERGKEIFENSNTDIRFTKQMFKGTGYPSGYVPAKLFQTDLGSGRGRLSLIRLSEVYLMAAEAALKSSTPDTYYAREMLVALRQLRGNTTEIKDDLSVEEMLPVLYKEYQREFYVEGVQFFLYKRLGVEKISSEEGQMMTPEAYRLPFPDFEVSSGRIQPQN